MIYMFISVMFVFEDGQYHDEQIKLGFRINEICFGSVYNAHSFNLHVMLALLLRFLFATTLKLCGFSFNNSCSIFNQIYLK